MSNEVAFVALAQSRGRTSEAAAVLHLPRAKDEAQLVTRMLDVKAFLTRARYVAEEQRLLRMKQGRHQQHLAARRIHQSPDGREHETILHSEWAKYFADQAEAEAPAQCGLNRRDPTRGHAVEGSHERSGVFKHDSNDHGDHRSAGEYCDRAPRRGDMPSRRDDRHAQAMATSISAPALLPPLTDLIDGTPPTPETLKTVLSTSTSVAAGIPGTLGLPTRGTATSHVVQSDSACVPTR